ncbi:MAG: tetratricopeptide repeat protein [Candidatus Acidiferrales bacterium]
MGSIALTLAALACLAAALQVRAQGMGTQQQQTQEQKPSLQNPIPQKPAAPVVDPKEEAAYKAFFAMRPAVPADFDAQIQSGEDFVKSYPRSRYLAVVYSRLTNAYFERQKLDKMYDAADKTLQLNPNDLTVLTLVGWVIPRGNPAAPDFADKLGKAEQYEKHSLEMLATLTKPAELTDDQFAKTKASAVSQAHSGLGLVYFREGKNDESAAELAKATDGNPQPDPTDYFVLGVVQEKLNKFSDAQKSFDSCAQIQSQLQDRCKQGSAEAKAKAGTQLQPPKP